ncbi:MAG: HIT family hydrolase [Betaproteobacteria bacterium RBG_16_64_9]|nr:MAG: HIT family hydrolase [Betaproteobacteria bacterium RBG_16_64_9]
MATDCELCNPASELVLWQDAFCRVTLVDDSDYPGFCRVILERHMSEMTDLSAPERARLMEAVFAAEAVLREVLAPDKINLASLGNVVAHLHWHVIPRYRDDRHFPKAIWAQEAEPSRRPPGRGAPDADRLARALKRRLGPPG